MIYSLLLFLFSQAVFSQEAELSNHFIDFSSMNPQFQELTLLRLKSLNGKNLQSLKNSNEQEFKDYMGAQEKKFQELIGCELENCSKVRLFLDLLTTKYLIMILSDLSSNSNLNEDQVLELNQFFKTTLVESDQLNKIIFARDYLTYKNILELKSQLAPDEQINELINSLSEKNKKIILMGVLDFSIPKITATPGLNEVYLKTFQDQIDLVFSEIFELPPSLEAKNVIIQIMFSSIFSSYFGF